MIKEYLSTTGKIWTCDSEKIKLNGYFTIPISKKIECDTCEFCVPRVNLEKENIFNISEADFGICAENYPKSIKIIMTRSRKELKCGKI